MLCIDIANHIKENIRTVTVRELSKKFFVSPDYINRIFKKEYGCTINQYIILMKIYNFEHLIDNGECLKNACNLSGFGNYSNFIRTYKNYRGYPPGQYINNKENKKIHPRRNF